MQIALVGVPCVATVNEQLELGMCHCVFGQIVKSPTHFFQKVVECVLFVTVMMRYYENMSEEFNVLGICSVGNDHSRSINCVIVNLYFLLAVPDGNVSP